MKLVDPKGCLLETTLLLARGACIETARNLAEDATPELLLARGACIETIMDKQAEMMKSGCSSQEEHVLKLRICLRRFPRPRLLLARGACIETCKPRCTLRPSRLLLARGACIETVMRSKTGRISSCSSQEEHVLKRVADQVDPEVPALLLARGACIETFHRSSTAPPAVLLLARGACIETQMPVLRRQKFALLLARGACIETSSPDA